MKEKKCVYAGTFDPITLGHIDVIKRALRVFDSIILAITDNPRKKPLFSLNERIFLTEKALKELKIKNVKVKSFNGLLVDFMKKNNLKIILRGLREVSDFEVEFQQAIVNKKLNNEIDTFFIMTDKKYFYLSSTLVKELALFNADLKEFVPKTIEKALKEKLNKC